MSEITENLNPKTRSKERIERIFFSQRGESITGRKLPTNYAETLIDLLMCYTGNGIFALGSALKKSGMLLGPILFINISLINLHCQRILVKASAKIAEQETDEVVPSYGETVQYTLEDSSWQCLKKYSKCLKNCTDVCVAATEYGYCVIYFISVSAHFTEIGYLVALNLSSRHGQLEVLETDYLQTLANYGGWNVDYRIMLSIILLPMWISTFLTSLKALAPVSFISNLFIWIGTALLLYYTTRDLVPLNERTLVSNYKNVPLFLGIAMYQFNGSTFILSIQKETEKPKNYSKLFGALNMSLFISVLLHLMVGFFSYWKYGEDVQESSLHNIPPKETIASILKVLMITAVLLTYSIHMYIAFEITYPLFYLHCGPFKHTFLIINAYKFFWVIVTYGLANISKKRVTLIIAFLGALSGSLLALIIPALLELAVYSGHLTRYLVLKNTFIIAFAVLVTVTGTISFVTEIIKDYPVA